MPKQMRKGTHSCLPCRRRKVRCWFSSDHASCVQCVRRKTACIPQGDVQHAIIPNPPCQLGTTSVGDIGLGPFFQALYQLRCRVEVFFGANPPPHAAKELSEPLLDIDTVHSNCAPVMRLLNHRLISRRTEPQLSQASERDTDPGGSSSTQTQVESPQSTKHLLALSEMCAALPSESDIAEILTTRNQWWVTWRQSFGLAWGEMEDSTLTQFATRAICAENPSLLGSLLLCFALSTGDYSRYIGPVERWMLSDNSYTTHEYDFQCLMGLGLCLISALQPRRAWLVYRKANALLQLMGIHRSRRRSESLDLIFWQLFSADRWVSLLIGLPYSVPDHMCYLSIPPIDQSTPITFHHRHMVLLTGRVIDCLQSPMGYSFSTVVGVDQEIDKITAQLPLDYLSMPHIAACPDADEKSARLYRITEISQLKTFLYLPLFLQQCDPHKQELAQSQNSLYGRSICLNSARPLLKAYLALYDMEPTAAVMDNSIKLTSFTALAAAVILFLNLLAGAHPTTGSIADPTSPSTLESDTMLISRTVAVFEKCSEGKPQSLCGQCHTALAELISCSQILGIGESRKITVPYFGLVEITRAENVPAHSPKIRDDESVRTTSVVNPTPASFVLDEQHDEVLPSWNVADDMFFAYHGPWESHLQESSWPIQSVEDGLDPSNVVLGQYLDPGFPV